MVKYNYLLLCVEVHIDCTNLFWTFKERSFIMKKKLRVLALALAFFFTLGTAVSASEPKVIENIDVAATSITGSPNVKVTVHGAVIDQYLEWDKDPSQCKTGEVAHGTMVLKAADGYVFSRKGHITRTENTGTGDNIIVVGETLSRQRIKLHVYFDGNQPSNEEDDSHIIWEEDESSSQGFGDFSISFEIRF